MTAMWVLLVRVSTTAALPLDPLGMGFALVAAMFPLKDEATSITESELEAVQGGFLPLGFGFAAAATAVGIGEGPALGAAMVTGVVGMVGAFHWLASTIPDPLRSAPPAPPNDEYWGVAGPGDWGDTNTSTNMDTSTDTNTDAQLVSGMDLVGDGDYSRQMDVAAAQQQATAAVMQDIDDNRALYDGGTESYDAASYNADSYDPETFDAGY